MLRRIWHMGKSRLLTPKCIQPDPSIYFRAIGKLFVLSLQGSITGHDNDVKALLSGHPLTLHCRSLLLIVISVVITHGNQCRNTETICTNKGYPIQSQQRKHINKKVVSSTEYKAY